MAALVKYADSDSTKDPESDDDKIGKGKKNRSSKGQQHHWVGNGRGGKRKADFKGYQVDHVDRRKNEAADALSRLGSQRKPVPPNVFLDVLHNPSVKIPGEEDLAITDPEAQLVAALLVVPDWTVPYLAYMT